ncbi:MAG: hypothetical protein M3R09_00030 [Actinomycetota bacterium]|nr:hypothetical protein [Actinomycetota bacterium]
MSTPPVTLAPAPEPETLPQRLARRAWALRYRVAMMLAGAALAWLCRHLPAAFQAACGFLIAVLEAVGA